MKNYIFLLVFVLGCLIAPGSFARDVKRVVTRSFNAVGGMQLHVDNKFGDIVIKSWDRNEINFSVEIKGKARKEEMAQRMADRVKISFVNTAGSVVARTVIAEKIENCSDCGVEINYTIQVPGNVYLNLVNKYGNILLDRAGFAFRGDINYGDIRIGELGGASNRIVCKYGNVVINKAADLSVDASHSDLTLNDVKSLTFSGSYCGIKVGRAERISLNSRYDNYQIGTVGELYANAAKYTTIRIESLERNLSVEGMAHGELKVSRLSVTPGKIRVNATYSNIIFGLTPRHVARVDISNRYGSISVSKNLNTSRLGSPYNLDKENDMERLFGIIGNGVGHESEIVIRTTHGKVRLGE